MWNRKNATVSLMFLGENRTNADANDRNNDNRV
jgi:hypothetical protein